MSGSSVDWVCMKNVEPEVIVPLSRRWPAPLAFAAGVAVLALACKKDAVPSAEPVAVVEPVAAAAGVPGPSAAPAASDRFDEAPFTLRLAPVGGYTVGTDGDVEVQLEAKSGFKCNDQYPYKFKAKEAADIEFAAPIVKQDAMKHEGKHRAVMKVRFKPKSAGKKTIAGQFSFSVCTEEQCLVEKRDLALDIDVK